jgi:hypothetical protein
MKMKILAFVLSAVVLLSSATAGNTYFNSSSGSRPHPSQPRSHPSPRPQSPPKSRPSQPKHRSPQAPKHMPRDGHRRVHRAGYRHFPDEHLGQPFVYNRWDHAHGRLYCPYGYFWIYPEDVVIVDIWMYNNDDVFVFVDVENPDFYYLYNGRTGQTVIVEFF